MRKAVLCVHDGNLVGSLKKRLEEHGFAEIIVCGSAGEVAIAAVDRPAQLALLECTSPGPEVLAAVHRIRERLSIPIIVVSASCSREGSARAAEAGASAVLTTPLREEEFDAAVQISLAGSSSMDTLRSEITTLKESLESRKVVEKAKGRLMERDKLSEAEAFRRMQRLAMDRRISMRQLAEAILLTDKIVG